MEFTRAQVKSKVVEKNDTFRIADIGHLTYEAVDSTGFIVTGLCKP
jgi:hypothetical protein